MNRYIFHIIASVICILIPLFGVWYGIWDSYQPKTGPVGNGYTAPKLYQLVPIISCFIVGVINLPLAIIRYRKYKETMNAENDKKTEDE